MGHRKDDIPEQFKDLLVPGKMQHVLCTGNVCSKTMDDYLRTLANSVHIVRGDLDSTTGLADLPETKCVKIGEFSIGICHGHRLFRGVTLSRFPTYNVKWMLIFLSQGIHTKMRFMNTRRNTSSTLDQSQEHIVHTQPTSFQVLFLWQSKETRL